MHDAIDADDLLARTALADVRVYPCLASTNTQTEQLLGAGAIKLPATVVALRQTAGRGQHHRPWFSDDGSLAVTFAMSQPVAGASTLPLRAGLAVREVVSSFVPSPHRVTVKWPNDVLIEGRKVAGILCQMCHGAAVIGIGINVNTDFSEAESDVASAAVAIATLADKPVARRDVLIALYPALTEAIHSDTWRDEFQNHHYFRDQYITLDTDTGTVAGLCRGVDEQGRLLIQTESSELKSLLTGRIRMAQDTTQATAREIF